ncbi:MAG: AAA family ATPase [Methanosarcinales archaeon]|uniref:AAA family ATPase n=1 Tax=Candidatus Ethanoperedens thermophilum TaxID=2766897 RepID=A0A848D7W1_9EURY|nr:AAA family ATPase [Candidatus Ethanoperedens thermophilum]
MKASNLREVYRVFDPQEPLKGEWLKEYYVERESPIDAMIWAIKSADKPSKILFAGTRGNGKTTELNRLVDKIKNDFFVVSFSIKDRLDMMDVKYTDILLAIGSGIYEKITEEIELDENLKKGLDDWSERVVEVIKEEQKGLELGAGFNAIVKLMGTIKSQSTTKEIMRKAFEPRMSDLIDNINKIIFAAESDEKLGKKLLVVVDDLDKIAPKQAEELFFGYATTLIQPSCKIIYTVPITIPFSSKFQQVIRYFDDHRILPNMKIFERDGTLNTSNQSFMKKIALNRMDKNLITENALNLAIENSGGLLQDFIRIIRNSANIASERENNRIEKEDIEKIISDIRNDYIRVLDKRDFELLHEIKSEHEKGDGDRFQSLLFNLVILEYLNDSIWYDVHPSIKGILK